MKTIIECCQVAGFCAALVLVGGFLIAWAIDPVFERAEWKLFWVLIRFTVICFVLVFILCLIRLSK